MGDVTGRAPRDPHPSVPRVVRSYEAAEGNGLRIWSRCCLPAAPLSASIPACIPLTFPLSLRDQPPLSRICSATCRQGCRDSGGP